MYKRRALLVAASTFDEVCERCDGSLVSDSERNITHQCRDINMVFQRFNLFPHMAVLENIIGAPIPVLGTPRAEALDQTRGLLERIDLTDKAIHYPSMLSSCQQQWGVITSALAMKSKPCSVLDPEPAAKCCR